MTEKAPAPENRSRISLFCDCCGKEKLAEIVDGKLVIHDRRHGKRHVFAERLDALLRAVVKSGELKLSEGEGGKGEPKQA